MPDIKFKELKEIAWDAIDKDEMVVQTEREKGVKKGKMANSKIKSSLHTKKNRK